MLLSIVSAVLVLVVFTLLIKEVVKPKNFPPGPRWAPLVGSAGALEPLVRKLGSYPAAYEALAKQYNTDILGLKSGRQMEVIIFGAENIKKALANTNFDDRPDDFFTRLRCFGKKIGITFADGPLWREHRQFTTVQLRHVGFGRTEMEREIQIQASGMAERIGILGRKEGALDTKMMLAITLMNVLWKYVAGEKINESKLRELLDLLGKRSLALSMSGGWLAVAPWARLIFPHATGFSLVETVNKRIAEIIDEAINRHKRREIEGNDFIYAFLEEMYTNKETYTDEQLRVVCLDLIIAASQNTANVLGFCLLALMKHPEHQERVCQELRALVPGVPSWSDVQTCRFTSSFIQEVERYYNVAPLLGPRRAAAAVPVAGHVVPAGATVMFHLAALHTDERVWGPSRFDPERFMEEKDNFYPFGAGRRRCPGNPLAKPFIFITLATLVRSYQVSPEPGVEVDDRPIGDMFVSPRPFKAVFTPRS